MSQPQVMFDDEEATSPSKPRHGARFHNLPLRTAQAHELACIALGIVEAGRMHSRLLAGNTIKDDDALEAIGLAHDASSGPPDLAGLRNAIRRRHRQLKGRYLDPNDKLQHNIEKLGEALGLDETNRRVLRLCVLATISSHFDDFCDVCDIKRGDLVRYLPAILKLSRVRLRHALGSAGKLRRAGMFESDEFGTECNPVKLREWVVQSLRAHDFEPSRLVRRIVKISPAPRLGVGDFDYIADRDLMQRYLTDAIANRRKGANILIHGQTGTGKTEFVRALTTELGARLYEVPNEDSDGDPISGERRFGAYSLCQRLLSGTSKEMLLFDEVEDVFGTSDLGGFLGFSRARFRDGGDLRKSWINDVLESNPVPTVWVCNSVSAMDPAYLRRFDIVVEFGAPGRAVRQRLVGRYFRNGEISPGFAARLADDARLAPANLERAARVVRTLRSRSVATREREVERLLTGPLRASGQMQPLALPAIPAHYDLQFLNADADLNAIADGLAHGSNARLCLYGTPGTGKTAFAHFLGRRLDRPVLVRRGSDFLNMYVGETEARIARAFAQARDDGAILVIDEADGFLRSRADAVRSWEVTQVNELLTQMEAFDGIFVASTNLIDTLDPASLRRFDFKIRFDYLDRGQRREFLSRVCAAAPIDPSIGARLDRLENIAPGDFANVLRQLRVRDAAPAPAAIIELLEREAGLKPDRAKRSVGFV